jgi:hypothetical protein
MIKARSPGLVTLVVVALLACGCGDKRPGASSSNTTTGAGGGAGGDTTSTAAGVDGTLVS